MKYRKKPVVIEAFCLGADPFPDWFLEARNQGIVRTYAEVPLQGAYAWSQGDVGGVVWKDLPLVDVDEEGKELP